ncbi:MAG: hypothetical protein V2I33_16365 [Kangiellaceae bacterium]|jgi:hypothetical protein|nr:hypothetical protein [Kangiellaceae bacterium]
MKCPNCELECDRILEDGHYKKKGHKCPVCPFITFDNEKIITEIAAVVSVDEKTGLEGLTAINMDGIPMPAVNTNYEFLKQNVYPIAKAQMPEGFHAKLKRFKLVGEEL